MTAPGYGAPSPTDPYGTPLPGVLRVLFVCTGNICRSPMAERLMRDALYWRVGEDARWVQVTSAGTSALAGHPADATAASVLAGMGVPRPDDFVARQLTPDLVENADLVLTAERAHRAYAVDLVPSAVRRVFTVLEFDRLLAAVDLATLPTGTPRERGAAMAHAATAMRGLVEYVEPMADDIADPYRRPQIQFERAAGELGRALRRPLDVLTGVRP